MTRKYRKEHDLMRFEAEDLISEFDGIRYEDVASFVYPENNELEQVGVRGIYLNNYIRWDSKTQHEKMIRLCGYESHIQTRTFDYYNDIDCWNCSDLHDHTKWLKHGYTKIVDHACRDIRLGHITRDQAIKHVSDRILSPPKNVGLFLQWIGMTENGLRYILDQHRNTSIWVRDVDWEWKLQNIPILDLIKGNLGPSTRSRKNSSSYYILTDTKSSTDPDDQYVLVGRGL